MVAGAGSRLDTIVVGGGIIGLATAWRLGRRGQRVMVVDSAHPHAASQVAAGMLTPATEASFGEEPLMRLAMASRDLYPSFVAEVDADRGHSPPASGSGYHRTGTLQVAFDQDDLARLDELRLLQDRIGVRTERLTSRACRRLEPGLAPGVRGGILAPDDHSVDPRALTTALYSAATRRGVQLHTGRVRELCVRRTEESTASAAPEPDAAVSGIRLDTGETVEASTVVLATGAWASELLPRDLAQHLCVDIRPVKGEVLRLRPAAGARRGSGALVSRTVRGLVRGSPVYLVPRDTGEIVLGATQEELGFDASLTAEGVWRLLRDAHELVPGVGELEITETSVGFRPGSPDNGPLLGPTGVPGLQLAAGHSRHGVLLAPITAEALAQSVTTGTLPAAAADFAATRFTDRTFTAQEVQA
ncbi:glycine oxidase ThiO [Lipingzhangella sp. LS1_29]|uniref:glycine oxidase n=1 Tax=Lipingzhangella rawalii TaxID=2055835 RepID=A0ABU2H159_9ACTN|nr:glycine oxidase ThiO [Lipingzhangella rawalii]MDS1268727.1 glycine oxidase ThiO [Lipingzhangella rawalii]